MKRICTIMLILATLLLVGCGVTKEEVAGTIEALESEQNVDENKDATTDEVPEFVENPVSMGRMEGGIYSNEYAGFACKLDSSWTFLGAEELQDMPENAKELMEGSELADSMDTMNMFTDMFAENAELLANINVMYTKEKQQDLLIYSKMSEEEIIDGLLQNKELLIETYTQAGIQVESIEKSKVTFAGETRTALKTVASQNGIPVTCIQLYYYGLGRYSMTLTVTCFGEDNSESIFDLFYAID